MTQPWETIHNPHELRFNQLVETRNLLIEKVNEAALVSTTSSLNELERLTPLLGIVDRVLQSELSYTEELDSIKTA